MSKSLPKATQQDAETFCHQCEWVYECWSMNLALHECVIHRRPLLPDMSFWNSPIGRFLGHHTKISSEYTLLEVAKLHDRRIMRGQGNLAIGFFVDQKDTWSSIEKENLDGIRNKLDAFYTKHIKPVRNKILTHSDLTTFRNNTLLGNFAENEGNDYFRDLGHFAAEIWRKWNCRMESPYQTSEKTFDFFPDSPVREYFKDDAEKIVDCIQLGYRELERRSTQVNRPRKANPDPLEGDLRSDVDDSDCPF